jgi:protein SCO1/2
MTEAMNRAAHTLAVCALFLSGCRQGDAERPESIVNASTTLPAPDSSAKKDCCASDTADVPSMVSKIKTRQFKIPDVVVVDQDGNELHFYEDIVKDRIVAINFVFTSCAASCPLLGSSYAKLQDKLGDRLGKDCTLISVSVDPTVDRPERLKEWADRFGRKPGWTLVTSTPGGKAELDVLLKALQVYAPAKADHSQSVIVVDGTTLEGRSSRRIAAPDELEAMLDEALRTQGGRNYFTDTTLVDHEGQSLKFYSDLVRGKVVVICPFFTSCTGSCVVTSGTLAKLQDRLGDRLVKDVVLISLTVDPDVDSPPRLAEYARKLSARPGWHFLTGEKANLAAVERKLGQYVEIREAHPTTMIVGNETTGLWLKHTNPSDVEGLIAKVEEALADVRAASAR